MLPLFQVAMSPQAVANAVLALSSGYVGQGPRVEEFEAAFGALVDAPYPPLAVNSGTSAIQLALKLIGVGPGDEVISTPMTCVATNAAVALSGATIVWADVIAYNGLIDPADVARKVTPRTKAIVAVDYGGHVCDYLALRRHGIPVIEDAAHALLANRRGMPISTSGADYICWSFQAIKHLTTVDGGALLAPRGEMERGRLLRWYGLDRRSNVSFRAGQNIREAGGKWHMNDVAAAIGLGNIPGARDRVNACRENAAAYAEALCDLDELRLPPDDAGAAWWLYTLQVGDREGFSAHMARCGVETGQAHARNDVSDAFATSRTTLPGVDLFAARQVSIPVGWWIDADDRKTIIEAVRSWRATDCRPTAGALRASNDLDHG